MNEMNPTLGNLMKNLSQFRKAYAKLCYPQLAPYALSPCEIDMMIFLSNNPDINTAKELTVLLGVAKSLIARSVDNLVKRNFLTITIDEKDRRIQHLSLAPDSDEILALIKNKQQEISTYATQGIPKEDLDKLQEVLSIINQNITCVVKGVNEE